MNQERVWDKIAPGWNIWRKTLDHDVQKFYETASGKMLDLGCGSGRNFVKKEGLQIFGIDFSGEMLRFAEMKAKELKMEVELKKAKSSVIPYSDQFFDFVLCKAVVHYIVDQSERQKTFQEIFRVLKVGGEALVSVWAKDSPTINGRTGAITVPWKDRGQIFTREQYIYEKDELVEELKSVGFEILDVKEGKNIEIRLRRR